MAVAIAQTLKDVYGSPLYGIKTGLNGAFVIDNATKEHRNRPLGAAFFGCG